MTFEQMKIFVEAAHCGSFTTAAEKLRLTQSAVSMAIKKIEEKHGVILFDRSGRRFSLTEAGCLLLNESERILLDLEIAVRRVESRRGGTNKCLVVACTPNAYDFWMPGLVAQAGGKVPAVDLICGGASEIVAWVMRGTADFGISEIAPTHPELRHVGIFSDKIILCATPARSRSLPPDVSWRNLQLQAPVLWERNDLAPIIVKILADHQIDAKRLGHAILRLTSTSSVLNALEGGKFVGFVTERAAHNALATKNLIRVGRIEIPLKYWMFALRDREIESLASVVVEGAQAIHDGENGHRHFSRPTRGVAGKNSASR